MINCTHITINKNGTEIGYWIGVPFWGNGYKVEVLETISQYAFYKLGLKTLFCGVYENNYQSLIVLEKSGFQYYHSYIYQSKKTKDKK